MVVSVLGYGSAAFAMAAAILWICSACIRTPDTFAVAVDVNVSPYDGSASGQGYSVALSELGAALKRQSQLSAQAAICAAIAAALQGGTILLPSLN